jgi:hypothetical protein
MDSQSKMLTGTLTGIKRWNECGDASFEDRRSGKPLSGTLGAEAERLAEIDRKEDRVARIKTKQRSREMISLLSATPLTSKDESLVAGNVTGGGGKATRTKT